MSTEPSNPVWQVQLPFPPSVNNLFIENRKTGRRYPSKQYRAWRKEADQWIMLTKPSRRRDKLVVRIILTPPDAKRRDVDNYTKAVLDALVGMGVMLDDSQVAECIAMWRHDRLPGALVQVVGVATRRLLPPLEPDTRPPLSPHRRAILASMGRRPRFLRPTMKIRSTDRWLIQHGYAVVSPGLFNGFAQGVSALPATSL